MPTRRDLLSSAVGAIAAGAGVYAATSALSSGGASIEWANEREEELTVRTTVVAPGGPLSAPNVVYERRYRLFPTGHYRAGDTNVVPTDTYDVSVAIESDDGSTRAGPATTTWTPAECDHQRLIVRVLPDLSIEFRQREC